MSFRQFLNYVYTWAIKGIAASYDKDDPDRVERWIKWLDSPYWSKGAKASAAKKTAADEELAIFAAAM